MTQPSIANPRWQVIRTFLGQTSLHATISSSPFVLFTVLPGLVCSTSASTIRYASFVAGLLVVGAIGKTAFKEYQTTVMPFFELAEVPVELARRQIHLSYRYLWPRTILMGCFSLGFVVLLSIFRRSQDTGDGTGQVSWFMLCGLAITGSFLAGNWVHKTLLHIYGPSAQAKYAKIAEAMDAGARAALETPQPVGERGKTALPFDRPPV